MTRRHWILTAIALFCFAAAKVAVLYFGQSDSVQEGVQQIESCELTQEGCVFAQGALMKIEGLSHQRAAFSLSAQNLPENVNKVEVSFEMKDMDMGFNRFSLRRIEKGVWRLENVYLPVCAANRHDWIMVWTVDEQKYSATFTTQ